MEFDHFITVLNKIKHISLYHDGPQDKGDQKNDHNPKVAFRTMFLSVTILHALVEKGFFEFEKIIGKIGFSWKIEITCTQF